MYVCVCVMKRGGEGSCSTYQPSYIKQVLSTHTRTHARTRFEDNHQMGRCVITLRRDSFQDKPKKKVQKGEIYVEVRVEMGKAWQEASLTSGIES